MKNKLLTTLSLTLLFLCISNTDVYAKKDTTPEIKDTVVLDGIEYTKINNVGTEYKYNKKDRQVYLDEFKLSLKRTDKTTAEKMLLEYLEKDNGTLSDFDVDKLDIINEKASMTNIEKIYNESAFVGVSMSIILILFLCLGAFCTLYMYNI